MMPLGTSTVSEPILMIMQVALPAPAGHKNVSPETDDTVEVCATETELKSMDE